MSSLSQLRKRRGDAQVHPDDGEELEQPLLTGDEVPLAAVAAATPRRSATEHHELPWPLSAVAHALSAAWSFMLGEAGLQQPTGLPCLPASLVQAA